MTILRVNMGVVAYSKEERFLDCKTTARYQRVTNMFPAANGRGVLRILGNFNHQLKGVSQELNELFTPSDSLEQITNSILTRDNSAIQLTEIKFAIDMNLESALKDLYDSQVEKYIQNKVDKSSLLDEDIWRTMYKSHFEKYDIDKRLKTHDVKIP